MRPVAPVFIYLFTTRRSTYGYTTNHKSTTFRPWRWANDATTTTINQKTHFICLHLYHSDAVAMLLVDCWFVGVTENWFLMCWWFCNDDRWRWNAVQFEAKTTINQVTMLYNHWMGTLCMRCYSIDDKEVTILAKKLCSSDFIIITLIVEFVGFASFSVHMTNKIINQWYKSSTK